MKSISRQKAARLIGVLFIIGTAAGIASVAFVQSSLQAGYLTEMAAHGSQLTVGVMLIVLMSTACAGIGVALYPVLKRYGVGWALGAAGFRIIEGAFELISAFFLLCLLAISRAFVAAGAPALSSLIPLGDLVRTLQDLWSNVILVIPWCVGAFIYYVLFYRHKLVPRWLSAWGILGIVSLLGGVVAILFGAIEPNGPLQTALNLPIALQEMVLAVWLIVKGFSPAEGDSPPEP
jgi:hypothetical protein